VWANYDIYGQCPFNNTSQMSFHDYDVELYIFITKQLDFNVFWHFRYHNQTFVAFSLVIVFLKSRSYIFFKNVEINNSNLTVLKPLMTPKKKKKRV
jgi:hypothetical protein